MHMFGRPTRHRRNTLLIAASTAAVLLSSPGTAGAAPADAIALEPHTTFTMAADGSSGSTVGGENIPNIDSDKATIRTYYNATNGIANKTESPYITEMKHIEDAILAGAPDPAPASNLAIVFDADDTTLMTYDMEDAAMHFNFDPALQNEWVQDGLFPATPGMVDVVNTLADRGYHIYGITGRTDDQEQATLDNLEAVGYTAFNADNFFTKYKVDPKPDYLDCNSGVEPDDPAKCTTVEYKAGTRKYIEDHDGMTIVANIGDQWSDLQGGHALNTVKLPNPTYYLPSPNIKGAPSSDAAMTPDTTFTMAPNGSSGATEGGEHIPNIDSVKATIRTYYNATNGIANKTSSPYITEMKANAAEWTTTMVKRCQTARKHHKKPAIVFDADDTTLWTYDMEDGAMKFNFNPTVQNDDWVQPEKFPATPGMVKLVRKVHKAKCRIVGITGRGANQRLATLDNLAKYYYDKKTDQPLFRSQYYFTKWAGSTPPDYVNCAIDSDPAKCSTIEYKSSTRKYVRNHFGFKIVGNFGDQFSDLIGGYGRPVKLPNPTYYLP